MKQLVQRLRDGSMEVLDVAIPDLPSGSVLVQNYYSVISAGTEASTVTTARKSLLGKAKERPDQVKQVLGALKQQGIVQTYRAVSKRLDAYSPLGYSSSGIALEVASDVRGISVGDHVACAGAGYASHAEIVAVPENLCVKLPAAADLARAAYNTLGAIALQGVRQADLRLGEACVVIGLGLLGQITCLILRASGVKTIGVDIDDKAVDTARRHCADVSLLTTDASISEAVMRATGGIGADAAIITAASESTQPVNLAGRLLRKRGCVVIVGNVPTGFSREPDYYRKELSLKMSCSYGPGRYDPRYEEKGLDYPPSFVRWTENRNMHAFQELLYSGAIDLDYLTTHRFPIGKALSAYDLIINKSEDYLGILIEYDAGKTHKRERIDFSQEGKTPRVCESGIGFIGAGSYAMSFLLPHLKRNAGSDLTGVMTSTGTSSKSVADKFGFAFAAASATDVIEDGNTGTVFIATRHDSHANYVQNALKAGKNVFVEKPLCLKRSELNEIIASWQVHKPVLMVGFNRRFSPLTALIKESLGDGPMSMIYRINAGSVPADSWVQDIDIGGGRIIGEACHFVDFMVYLNGSLPTKVHASALEDPSCLQDTVIISLQFENGSIGSISYFANGPKSLAKEYIEVYKDGLAARLSDFKETEIYGGRKPIRKKLLNQDKGQKAMVDAFLSSSRKGVTPPISLADSVATTITTFAVLDSLRSGQAVELDFPSSIGET